MKLDNSIWTYFQKHLGYTDEEMEIFKANPRNVDVLSKGQALMNKTIIAEVIQSHGCNSQHKVGDKFYFDGAGNLLTKLSPSRICVYALSSIATAIFTANELFYAGVDPNEMRFKHGGCFDVGVRCGGWGRIIMELKVVDRSTLQQ